MWVVLVVFFALCGVVVLLNAAWTIRQMVLHHRRGPDVSGSTRPGAG